VPPRLAWHPTKKSAGDGGKQACQPHSLQVRPSDIGRAIPSALITVASPARTTGPLGRSAGDSQAHSLSALISGFHLPPTLWIPLWQLLLLIPVVP